LDKILEKSGIDTSKKARSPYVMKLSDLYDDDEKIDATEYLELIGLLNYLAVLTRPDILYALSRCAQRCANPTKRDLRRVRRIFYYLNGTKKKKLTFHKGKVELTAWVDASHMHYEDAKAQIGYCFSLGKKDGCFYSRYWRIQFLSFPSPILLHYLTLYVFLSILHYV